MKVGKKVLLLINALVFGVPGIFIAFKGISAYISLGFSPVWLLLVSVSVLIGFVYMFSRIVDRYLSRILSLEGKYFSVFKAFTTKGYILILSMMALGIVLKHIPSIPLVFYASFYCGLGPALLFASAAFISRMENNA